METNGRVTNRELYQVLDERTERIRSEQKVEHLKTRAWVAVVSAPLWAGKAIALLASISPF